MIRNNTFFLLLLLLSVAGFGSLAQDRVEVSKYYKSGESLLAPTYGIEMTIPANWIGYLPRDTEIFMMNSDSSVDARCLYFASQSDLDKIKSNWKKGFPLAPGLKIVTDGRVRTENGVLSAAIEGTNNASSKGFVFAKCGDYDYCVTVMMYTGARFIDHYRDKLDALIDNVTFVKPTPAAILDFFNWQKELTGKFIFSYERNVESKKKTEIWLYLDGTFKSKVKGTGLFKSTVGNYKGNKRGTYQVYNEKDGQSAKLVLFFDRLAEVTLPLDKDDLHLYINGQLFFTSQM